jgi:tRNA A37 threonylcarbamoyladenosine synthetase subunit TsaC/SUA5/YrdC
LSTADIFNIFEGPNTGASGFNNYPFGQTWYQSYPSNRFSNIVYDVPSSSLASDITRAAQLNAGSAYITDQTTPNPYAQLPSYWDQEVSAIVDLPEPGALASLLVLVGGLIRLRPTAARARKAGSIC